MRKTDAHFFCSSLTELFLFLSRSVVDCDVSSGEDLLFRLPVQRRYLLSDHVYYGRVMVVIYHEILD